MTLTSRRTLLYVVIIALAGAVLCVAFAAVASAEDCTGPQCRAREPSNVAEPAPLPRIYLPAVLQRMPAMSAESTPLQPMPTVTPEVPVTGDVAQEGAQ